MSLQSFLWASRIITRSVHARRRGERGAGWRPAAGEAGRRRQGWRANAFCTISRCKLKRNSWVARSNVAASKRHRVVPRDVRHTTSWTECTVSIQSVSQSVTTRVQSLLEPGYRQTVVSHYHTPSRELMAHTLTLLKHESGYGGYLWTKVNIDTIRRLFLVARPGLYCGNH